MTWTSTETKTKAFYDQWKGRVFLFCRLCAGESEAAENASRQTFLAYFREDGNLSLNQIPLDLLRFAADSVEVAARNLACPRESSTNLPEAILHLPWPHRAVFVLSCVFGLSSKETGFAARLSPQEVKAMSFGALLAIRDLLPKRNYKQEHCR